MKKGAGIRGREEVKEKLEKELATRQNININSLKSGSEKLTTGGNPAKQANSRTLETRQIDLFVRAIQIIYHVSLLLNFPEVLVQLK